MHASPPSPILAPDDALLTLLEGNRRYVAQRIEEPGRTLARVAEVARSQRPLAAILGCADARVPPEILFDQGIGDLFVIRVAGNVLDDAILGSLEYAVGALGVGLILVLGHERCGAVAAAVTGLEADGKLRWILDTIRPSIGVLTEGPDPVEQAIQTHLRRTVATLAAYPAFAHPQAQGNLKIVGARYDLDTAAVQVL